MEQKKELVERKNKTAIKRDMLALRDLGKRMIALSANAIQELPVGSTLKQELIKTKKFSKGALRRQLIYLEKLIREEDAIVIERHLKALDRPHEEETERFHQLEQWRDQLIAGDNQLLEKLISRFPQIDRQYVRQLTRNAKNELKRAKPPKSSRVLFRYLSSETTTGDDSLEA